jgi:hypothetical protein
MRWVRIFDEKAYLNGYGWTKSLFGEVGVVQLSLKER